MEETIQVVTLEPATAKWGKDRIKRHGPEFELVKRASYRGQPAILCRGLQPAYRDGSKWLGWFILDIDAKIVKTETVTRTSDQDSKIKLYFF